MTKTARQQGFTNLFFTLLFLLLVAGIMALIISFGFGQSVGTGLVISFISLGFVIGCLFIITWLKNRKQAGPVLLDVMPFPNRILAFLMGGLIMSLSFLGAYDFVWANANSSRLVSLVISLPLAIFYVFMGLGRIQIREKGIWIYADLVKWNKIESFTWVEEGGKMSTLRLRFRGRLPAFLRNGALPVPSEKKDKLESILELYLPDQVAKKTHLPVERESDNPKSAQ